MMEFDLQLFNNGEKTEQPTAKRRLDSRNKGQVVKSQEVTGAIILLVVMTVVRLYGGYLYTAIRGLFEYFLSAPVRGLDETAMHGLVVDVALSWAKLMAPIMAAAYVTGVVVNMAQVGFLFTAKPLAPDLNRINPLAGLKKIFSRRAAVDMVKAILKLTLIGGIAVWTLHDRVGDFPALLRMPIVEVVSYAGALAWTLVLRAGVALMGIAAFDYYFQKREHEQQLKMTKQEVKQEFKEMEGDPHVRSRIKGRQQEAARRRMMQAIPTADVVVTNPLEFAVALKYDADNMAAPTVVAKGQRLIADRIREIAGQHGVPIIPNPPLARALYRMVDVGGFVPEELYQAVAELLALVFRTRRGR